MKGLESTASLLETPDATQKLGIAMAATATAVARRRRNALLMRAIVIFMKTVLVVLCAPRTLVLCLKILQKLSINVLLVASSHLGNISMVYIFSPAFEDQVNTVNDGSCRNDRCYSRS